MSKGRHQSGQSTAPTLLIAGSLSVAAGTILLPIAVAELLRYSPYEDPGAGQTGLMIGLLSITLLGIPALALAVRAGLWLRRQRKAWLASLTPEQRGRVYLAEAAGMTALHLYLRHHHRGESERLAASVMGTGTLSDVQAGTKQMTGLLAQHLSDGQP